LAEFESVMAFKEYNYVYKKLTKRQKFGYVPRWFTVPIHVVTT